MSDYTFAMIVGWLTIVLCVFEGLYMLIAPEKYPPGRASWTGKPRPGIAGFFLHRIMWRGWMFRHVAGMNEAQRNRSIRLEGLLWLAGAAVIFSAIAGWWR